MMGERGYKSATLYVAGRTMRGYAGIGIKAPDASQDSIL
jgi:hypothetical protein